MLLIRLIPFCERNYNLIELGPKGTGKSHIFSEFSPHGILISGGEVTVAKLFVNNSNGKIGLVGYWDNVAFDEFAGQSRRVDQALVDIMKNYMANKSFSRGRDIVGADASMVFVGNTSLTVEMLLRQGDLFQDLPSKYHDTAFLDRIHFYIPGWEFAAVRKEFYTTGYGVVVDYLAEVLRYFRNVDYSQRYMEHFELSSDLSDRDTPGIRKTFSGLMKIIFPQGTASVAEMEWLMKIAINCALDVMKKRQYVSHLIPEFEESIGSTETDYAITMTLADMMDSLHEDERSVVVLKYYQDYTFQQISDLLEWSIGTVKTTLYRAVDKLRREWKEADCYGS
jgi:ATP-dependent Lon protease